MSPTPRRICFMVMPFGKKKTDAPTGQGVAEIDFDALWDKAFIRDLMKEPGWIAPRTEIITS